MSMPSLYFLHGILGVGSLALAFLHRHNLITMGQLIHLTGDWAWYLSLGSMIYAVIFLSGWLVDRFRIIAKLKRFLEHVFKHQITIWLHRLNLIAIILIWLHVHLIGRINAHFVFMTLFDLYTFGILGWYLWNLLFPKQTKAIVTKKAWLNETTFQLNLKLEKPFKNYQAGDFYFLKSKTVKEARPFSVTEPSNDKGKVLFTIRVLGDDTKKLSQLNLQDQVELEGPFGHFAPTIKRHPNIKMVFIGMGTGISPLLSLAQKFNYTHPIKILWCVHQKSDLYYDEELTKMTNNNLIYHHQIGHFNLEQLNKLISHSEFDQALFVIVGPSTGVLSTRKILSKKGVARDHILDERITM
ncbi:ferric reductase [Xylocopilactobacillus apis]|uniref:Ferric reductase n=2 Tax=Xylocopilactobacillus apis TaxID=2932183 RepID=A0AAU9CWL4_9LACO|nr:ferric reductase [Xylocopilactobacillus apis]